MSIIHSGGSRGSTFISIVLFSLILFAMSAGFLLMTTGDYRLNRRSYDSSVAINLAEAGVDYAIWAINLPAADSEHVSQWEGLDLLRTKPIRSFQTSAGQVMGDIDVEVADSTGTNPLVTSTGYVPGVSSPGNMHRTVKVKLSSQQYCPFKGVFFGNDYVHLHGSSSTDSYDSMDGAYGGDNVHSNGDVATFGTIVAAIDITGTAVVHGDAATGPGGTVSGEDAVTGEITHDQVPNPPPPPVTVPSELVSLSYGVNGLFTDGLLTRTGSGSASIPSGNWKLKRIKLTASATLTITGPAKIYLTGDTGDDSIAQSGASSSIICNGKVEFYADQKVTSSGNGMINSPVPPSTNPNPADCMIWGTSTCTSIKMSGSSSLYAAVYAPSALIDPSGGGDRYGAYVGKMADCTGSGVYHYDEALAALGIGGSSGYAPSYWQEK